VPIQFPNQGVGPRNVFSESAWLRRGTKAFAAVPAPNMGQPGMDFVARLPNQGGGFALNPGIGVTPFRAVNLRLFRAMYVGPTETARISPSGLLDEILKKTNDYDRMLGAQNMMLSGISRDAAGAALGGVTVNVFRTPDNTLVDSTVSDGSGNWSLLANTYGPFYFVEYKSGSPDVFGTSKNSNLPVPG
jgi:hypothetical protein